MSDKSYVGMGFLVCPVTGEKHSESVLLDKSMKDRLEKENFMGYAYSPEVDAKIKAGYVCLIEVKNDHNEVEKISMKDADRTGVYCFVKKELVKDMFGSKGDVEEVQFITEEVTQFLSNLKNKIESDGGKDKESEI